MYKHLRLLLSVFVLSGCVEPAKPDAQRQQALRDTVSKVIVPTYAELAKATTKLAGSTAQLKKTPTAEALRSAQDDYRAARGVWKQSEAFTFGPAEDLSITAGAIDSWPVDAAKLEALVSGTALLDMAAASRLGANLRGFPGLEHLLFDSSAPDAVLERLIDEGAGPRRLALAESLAKDLAARTKALHEAWAPAQGNYAHELAEAGTDSELFTRQSEGIDELVTGMLYLGELMVEKKLAMPLGVEAGGTPQPELEEAARSDGSFAHLRDNLRGLEAIYLCRRGSQQGVGLSDAVRKANAGVDMRFRQALTDALAAVDAAPVSFREALADDPAPVEQVYQKVRAVKLAIVTEVASALGASIGFGYSDTD